MINVEKLGRRPWIQWLTWPAGKLMASPLRRWIMNPEHLLQNPFRAGLKSFGGRLWHRIFYFARSANATTRWIISCPRRKLGFHGTNATSLKASKLT